MNSMLHKVYKMLEAFDSDNPKAQEAAQKRVDNYLKDRQRKHDEEMLNKQVCWGSYRIIKRLRDCMTSFRIRARTGRAGARRSSRTRTASTGGRRRRRSGSG